jgi:hypothetical protein
MAQPASASHLDPAETRSKVVWPTIGATGCGRFVGRLGAIRVGFGSFFTLGTVLAVATIPISLAVFAWQLLPVVMRRYCLTNRRVIVQKGLARVEERSIGMDRFDALEIRLLPGQEWLHCGDVVFLCSGREVFRLAGVPRPQTFRELCLKQRYTLLSVAEVLRQQNAASA